MGILRRLLTMIRYSFPGARIRVRLDGGFAHPALLDFLAEPNLEYVVAMAKNAGLKRKAKPMRQARRLSRHSGKTEHVYGEANSEHFSRISRQPCRRESPAQKRSPAPIPHLYPALRPLDVANFTQPRESLPQSHHANNPSLCLHE